MENNNSKVYILLDENNHIIGCEGGYTINNIDNIDKWVFIDEGFGDKYNLCQSNYLDGGLYTDDGVLRWKYEGGKCTLRDEAELTADRKLLLQAEPSQLDHIEAQVMYTALITDSLIEEDI